MNWLHERWNLLKERMARLDVPTPLAAAFWGAIFSLLALVAYFGLLEMVGIGAWADLRDESARVASVAGALTLVVGVVTAVVALTALRVSLTQRSEALRSLEFERRVGLELEALRDLLDMVDPPQSHPERLTGRAQARLAMLPGHPLPACRDRFQSNAQLKVLRERLKEKYPDRWRNAFDMDSTFRTIGKWPYDDEGTLYEAMKRELLAAVDAVSHASLHQPGPVRVAQSD